MIRVIPKRSQVTLQVALRLATLASLAALTITARAQENDRQRARRDGSPVYRSSEDSHLARLNLDRVAASATQIRDVLLRDPGMLVEVKKWVAKQATDNGQVVEDSTLTARILWGHRSILFRAFICGELLSAAIAFSLPKGYEATTKLMPSGSSSNGGEALLAALSTRGASGMLGGLAGDFLGVRGNGAVFVEILERRTVADRMIEQFQLAHEYHITKIEYTRKMLESHTKIMEDQKSGFISITVTDHTPSQAAAMAQAYVTALDHLVAQLSTSSARRERTFLEDRLKTVKGDLDEAAIQLSEFASKNTAIDIPAQAKALVEAAAVLQGQLIAAEAEVSGLEKIYAVNNVRVRALEARIAELRQQLQKLGGSNSPADVRNDNSLYLSIGKLPLLGVTYADLFRRTKIEETVYELLTQQYELAKVQEAKEIPSVKILDTAVVPTVKSFPHRVWLTQAPSWFCAQQQAGFSCESIGAKSIPPILGVFWPRKWRRRFWSPRGDLLRLGPRSAGLRHVRAEGSSERRTRPNRKPMSRVSHMFRHETRFGLCGSDH
jgi:capsule polysaccharide export protein KpsE/RkpR